MEQLRVVEVVESAAYGTGRHVVDLSRGLRAQGFDVTLIASTRRDRNFRRTMTELETDGVRCIELDMRRRVSPIGDLLARHRLKKLLAELKPTIVHGHGSKGGFLARAAAHSLGIEKTVYTPHCFAFAPGHGGMRERFYRWMERLAGRWTARLIAVSTYEAELAEHARIVPRDRIICIPNGLRDEELEPVEPSPTLAAELGLPKDTRVIGFVGRLCRQKGIESLIMAFADVAGRMPGCSLLLVGDGPEESSLRQLARACGIPDRIVFAGRREDTRQLLALMDVFVLSSRWESAPYAVLEAMASGTPIVATQVGGVPEMLDEGRCGRLVASGDPRQLAEAILLTLTHREESVAMAQAARERVRTRYLLSASVAQTAKLYRELADHTQ